MTVINEQGERVSAHGLQELIGRAIVSQEFRAELLSPARAGLLAEFDLDPDEFAAILLIHADTLAEFAAQIDTLVRSHAPASAGTTPGA